MAIQNDYPVIDGIAPSWSDIIIRATPVGLPLIEGKQFKSLDRTRTVTVGEQKGASGGRVLKRTTGEVKLELKGTMYRDGYNELLEKISAIAPQRGNQRAISLVHFGFQVQHTPIGSTRIFEWRAKGVRLLSDAHSHAEGSDADTVDITFSTIEIVDMILGKEVVFL